MFPDQWRHLLAKEKWKDCSCLVFSFGLLTYLFTSILVITSKKDVAGANFDSQFYLSSFSKIATSRQVISSESFDVASSPIFVHIVGFFAPSEDKSLILYVHSIYIFMAMCSILLIVKMLHRIQIQKRIALTCLITSSGYFVAPSIWPTSDTPATLFMILAFYYYFFKPNQWIFSLFLFALLSTRQSFAWLLVSFIVLDITNIYKCNLKQIATLFAKYLPSVLSLLVTYLYFDFRFTPKNYEKLQEYNVYPIPNFMSPLQIGLNLTLILTPVLVFLPYAFFKKSLSRMERVSLLVSACLTFGVIIDPPNGQIPSGLSWLSVFFGVYSFPLVLISLLAFAGFALFIGALSGASEPLKKILFVVFSLFACSSLFVSIPFLRYFEISTYIVLVLTLAAIDEKKLTRGPLWPSLGVCFVIINVFKILG